MLYVITHFDPCFQHIFKKTGNNTKNTKILENDVFNAIWPISSHFINFYHFTYCFCIDNFFLNKKLSRKKEKKKEKINLTKRVFLVSKI
jgi:hypothetical protein